MWRRRREESTPDPHQEVERFFADSEKLRLEVLHSHQVVHLSGRGLSTAGVQPTLGEMVELRQLLTVALQETTPKELGGRAAGYTGFFLVDPYDDDRITDLSEVPEFSPLRRWADVYHVYDGVLEVGSVGTFHPAAELERWLKKLWTGRGFVLPLHHPREA